MTTKRLNEQVKRNGDRFLADFLFQLNAEEHATLSSQNATSNTGRGSRRYPPYAFTEHGAIMAAPALNSARVIKMSVFYGNHPDKHASKIFFFSFSAQTPFCCCSFPPGSGLITFRSRSY